MFAEWKSTNILKNIWVIESHQLIYSSNQKWGFPGSSTVKNPLAMQEPQEIQVQSLGWEDSLEEEMATHSSILA